MNDDKAEQVKSELSDCGGFMAELTTEKERLDSSEISAEESRLHAAMVEAAYLMAAANGEVTQEEADAMADGLYKLTDISEQTLGTLFEVAGARLANEGADARIAAIGQDVTDEDQRKGVFLVAAAVSWKGGGIGMKEGLALQALSRAFGIPMNAMHKLLAKAHG